MVGRRLSSEPRTLAIIGIERSGIGTYRGNRVKRFPISGDRVSAAYGSRWTTTVAIADRVTSQVSTLRADFCWPQQASLPALLTKPKPTAETASSSLLCDTVVTQTPVERFISDINGGHRLVVNHERLLDTQEDSGSSPLGPTRPRRPQVLRVAIAARRVAHKTRFPPSNDPILQVRSGCRTALQYRIDLPGSVVIRLAARPCWQSG